MSRSSWHDLYDPSDNYGASYSVLFVTFLLGLTPLRVKGNVNERHMKISRFGYVNAMLQLVFFMFCFIHTLVNEESIVSFFFKSEISKVGDTLQKFIGMLGMILLFTTSLAECRKLMDLCDVLANVDTQFLELGVIFNYRAIMHLTQYKLLFVILVNAAYVSSSFWLLFRNDIWPTFQGIISFFIPNLFFLSIVVLYSAFVFRLQQHFSVTNKLLDNLLKRYDKPSIKALNKLPNFDKTKYFSICPIVGKTAANIVQECMQIHQLINRAAQQANNYFTYQLLTIISIAFLIIVFDAYYVLETLLGKSNGESKFNTTEFVTFFCCQMVLYFIAIISIVEGGSCVSGNSEQTASLVHVLLTHTKDLDMQQQLHAFSLQLLHCKINFTAGGLFIINRTLYFTICGALTTYLIILLQFTTNVPQCKIIYLNTTNTSY